jgi:hypothetical protein
MLVALVLLTSSSDATLPTTAPEDNKKILETLLTAESNKENISNETGRKQWCGLSLNFLFVV